MLTPLMWPGQVTHLQEKEEEVQPKLVKGMGMGWEYPVVIPSPSWVPEVMLQKVCISSPKVVPKFKIKSKSAVENKKIPQYK